MLTKRDKETLTPDRNNKTKSDPLVDMKLDAADAELEKDELSRRASEGVTCNSTTTLGRRRAVTKPKAKPKDKLAELLFEAEMRTGELLTTETRYVDALKEVVHGYIPRMEGHKCEPDEDGLIMPEDIVDGKDKIVMGNVRDLLSLHENVMLPEFRLAIENPRRFEDLFRNNMDTLKKKYGKYCLNLPKSQLICKQNTDYFYQLHQAGGFKQSLHSRLGEVHPRMGRCGLLFDEIQKTYRKAKDLAETHGLPFDHDDRLHSFGVSELLVNEISDYANGMMDAGRIDNYNGTVTSLGLLLLKIDTKCYQSYEGMSKKRPNMRTCLTFLFADEILICDKAKKKNSVDGDPFPHVLSFWTSFQMNKLEVKKKDRGFGPANCCVELIRKGPPTILVGNVKESIAKLMSTNEQMSAMEINQFSVERTIQHDQVPSLSLEFDSVEERDQCFKVIDDKLRSLQQFRNNLTNPTASSP